MTSRAYLVEVVELDGGDGASDARRDRFARVAHEIRNAEDLGSFRLVRRHVEVPVNATSHMYMYMYSMYRYTNWNANCTYVRTCTCLN